MKITLAVLFLAGLTIYCKCAAVLSLPPSLIAAHDAASLTDGQTIQKSSAFEDNGIPKEQQQLKQQANGESLQDATATATTNLNRNFKNLWHKNLSFFGQKRERNTFDDDIANVDDVVSAIKQNGPGQHDNDSNVDGDYDNNNGHKNNNNNNNKNENENMFLKASADADTDTELNDDSDPIDLTDDTMASSSWVGKSFHKREALVATPSSLESEILNRYFKSLKHGANRCGLENQDNCLQEYYGDLIANRNKALLKQQKQQQQQKENLQATTQFSNNINNDDDIVLLLTGEQNLIKFLSWALSQLYPFGKFTNVTASDDSADFYHPGMYMWKKLNLSGRLQPPLLIEEPHYVIVRKDLTADDDDNEENDGLNYGRDPFIPPRGRKHNLPDLDSLLHRYETFVPNRGRRDKIKDIFKYDDLFYPNRGKRQMIVTPATAASAATQLIIDNNGDIDESQVNNYNNDHDDAGDDDDVVDDDIKYHNNEENAKQQMYQQQLTDPAMSSNELLEYIENLMAKMKRKLPQNQQQQLQLQLQTQKQKQNNEKIANSFDEMMSNSKQPTTTRMSSTSTSASWPKSLSLLLNKRFKSTMFNILHNRQQQQNRQQQHLPKHYRSTRQWWKRYATADATEAAAATRNNHESPLSMIRSPTMATNRLQTLRSMSLQQQQLLKQLYEQHQQQHGIDLSPPHMNGINTKFMWQQQQQQQQRQRQPKSLAQQFDPLFWHKLQMLQQQQQQHDYQPSLTIRHPRLTALQHLPVIQQQQQHVATPQETQLTFASDQLDNGKTNDLDYMDNKMDLD